MKHILHWMILPLLLAACASPSKPAAPFLPDGEHRRPVNTTERIEIYRNRLSGEAAEKTWASKEQRRIDELEREFAALRDTLATQADAKQNAADASTAQNGMEAPSRTPVAAGLAPNETVRFLPRAITFSVPFTVGGAGFNPSAPLRLLLLRAAGDSPRIEVRGRTDADTSATADGALARQRAAAAREFLISQGIAASRVHSAALASGGHVADNTTELGKAQNRRVDIEVMDIDPLIYTTGVQTTEGEQNESD